MTSTSRSREVRLIRVSLELEPKSIVLKRCIWERERNLLPMREHDDKFAL